MTGFRHDIAGGNGNLIATSVQSPDFETGVQGWQIAKNGLVEFNSGVFRGTVSAGTFEGADFLIDPTGMYFYDGTPGIGNLIGAWSSAAQDPFGNPINAVGGLQIGSDGANQIFAQPNVNQQFNITSAIAGVFEAMFQYTTTDSNEIMPSMMGSVLLGSGTATKMSSVFHSPFGAEGAVMLLESQNDAGTDTPVITFGTVEMPDGMTMVFTPIMTLTPYAMVCYSDSSSQTVKTFTSSTTWTAPTGVTQVQVGTSAITVTAHGAGTNNTSPSPKGTGSTNTIHFNGGNCTDSGGVSVGGGGGGGSGGVSSAGKNGSAHNGSKGGAGAGAVAGGGAGGSGGFGGSTSATGTAGGSPGGGGGTGGSTASSGSPGEPGANGQVRLTYTTGSPSVGFSMNFGSSFNDQFGNTIAAGINTTQPIIADSWHSLGTLSGTGSASLTINQGRYRLTNDGECEIDVWLTATATTTAGTAIAFANNLPPAYQFTGNMRSYPVGLNGSVTASTNVPALRVAGTTAGTPGQIQLELPSVPSTTNITVTQRIPLN